MKKILSLFLMVVIMGSSVMNVCAEVSEEAITREKIEKKVRGIYKNDFEFKREVEDLGEDSGEEMIQQIIKAEFKKNTEIQIRGGNFNGSEIYCEVPIIKQINGYYCGPATTLQTLYGIGVESQVSGNTDSIKQNTLGSNMKTQKGEGTLVYRLKNELNKYVSDNKYIYRSGESLTINEFSDAICGSLGPDRPVVLHSHTKYFKYYKGKNFGHYVNLDYMMVEQREVRIADPHYSSKYRGYHDVSLQEAYDSISKPVKTRYVIYAL